MIEVTLDQQRILDDTRTVAEDGDFEAVMMRSDRISPPGKSAESGRKSMLNPCRTMLK